MNILALRNSFTTQSELNHAAWAIAHHLAGCKKGSKKFFGQALKQCHAVITRYATSFVETAKNYTEAAAAELNLNKSLKSFNVESVRGGKPTNSYLASFPVEEGELTKPIEWDSHRHAKNYIANVKYNPSVIEYGGIERIWVPISEGRFYVKQKLLILGECYEFSASSVRKKSRRYAISTLLFFENINEMFSFKKELCIPSEPIPEPIQKPLSLPEGIDTLLLKVREMEKHASFARSTRRWCDQFEKLIELDPSLLPTQKVQALFPHTHATYGIVYLQQYCIQHSNQDILTCFGKIKESVPLLFGEWKGDEEKKNEVLSMFDDLIEKLKT